MRRTLSPVTWAGRENILGPTVSAMQVEYSPFIVSNFNPNSSSDISLGLMCQTNQTVNPM